MAPIETVAGSFGAVASTALDLEAVVASVSQTALGSQVSYSSLEANGVSYIELPTGIDQVVNAAGRTCLTLTLSYGQSPIPMLKLKPRTTLCIDVLRYIF